MTGTEPQPTLIILDRWLPENTQRRAEVYDHTEAGWVTAVDAAGAPVTFRRLAGPMHHRPVQRSGFVTHVSIPSDIRWYVAGVADDLTHIAQSHMEDVADARARYRAAARTASIDELRSRHSRVHDLKRAWQDLDGHPFVRRQVDLVLKQHLRIKAAAS